MAIKILGSRFGMMLFLLLRNDWVWHLLSEDERQIVKRNNARHNVLRPDYANPECYQGGNSYDNQTPNAYPVVERELGRFLKQVNPKRVLEIGPGSGYHTRAVVEYPSVVQYVGTDINKAFLDYLEPRLHGLQSKKAQFSYSLIEGDFIEIDFGDQQFDAVVILSAVHHIPDREEMYQKLERLLSPGGSIFMEDPSHYIPRLLHLSKKLRTIYDAEHCKDLNNYSTHHFCTYGETAAIVKRMKHLFIRRSLFYRISFPIPIRKAALRLLRWLAISPAEPGYYETERPRSLLRYFSHQFLVVVAKTETR